MIVLSAFCDEASPDLAVQTEVARRAGLSRLDVRMVGKTHIADLLADQGRAVASRIADAGLEVGCLGSGVGKIDAAEEFAIDRARMERLASHADALKCRSVRVFSYFNGGGLDHDAWGRVAADRLGQLKQLARKFGLTLLLENERHLYGDRLGEMRELAGLFYEPGVFELIFDFDNYNQSGDNPWENWQALKTYIRGFHLKDSTREKVHVPIGQGAGRAREILADAAASGWAGLLSVEPHLAHSQAVMATGPSGSAAMQGHDPVDAFLHGVLVARSFLDDLGIIYT